MENQTTDTVYLRFKGPVIRVVVSLRQARFQVSDLKYDKKYPGYQKYHIFNSQCAQIGELEVEYEPGRRFLPRDSPRWIKIFRGQYQSSKLENFARHLPK